jgi:hypothetical protein
MGDFKLNVISFNIPPYQANDLSLNDILPLLLTYPIIDQVSFLGNSSTNKCVCCWDSNKYV